MTGDCHAGICGSPGVRFPRATRPTKAVVLCMDEKSQIQALDRTQPSLPMTRGRAGTLTHDYKRNGTTTLFAALDVATGKVFGQCLPRHRHEEFLTFLRTIDRNVPKSLQVHLILDNYHTHKHPQTRAWLAKHSRFHLHFTPTSSSWLNLVERWFRELTDKNLRRGSFPSVPELIASIEHYLASIFHEWGSLTPGSSGGRFWGGGRRRSPALVSPVLLVLVVGAGV